jgi:hypothetical protein
MAKKKKKNKTTGPARAGLIELLEGGGEDGGAEATRLEIEPKTFEAALATGREMIERGPDPRKLIELPVPFQIAFLQIAERDEDDDLIGDLYGMSPDKDVKKEAKRILHRLRSRGLQVELPEQAAGSVLSRAVQAEEKPLACFLSPITGAGNQMILMARYTHGGVAVHQAELNDVEGLTQFAGGTIGRNRYRQMSQEMASDPTGQLLEISYEEARWHLAQSVERCRTAGKALPKEYLEASGDLGEVQAAAASPTPAERFPADGLADRVALLERAPELLELPEFGDWLPDEETIQAIDEKIKQVEASQLTINDQQRIDQVQRIIDGGVDLMLADEDKRRRYHNRLLEAAVYLDRTGQPDRAALAAAAAWQLLDEDFQPSQSQLFGQLFLKIFRSAEEIVANMAPAGQPPEDQGDEPKASSGNLIITP